MEGNTTEDGRTRPSWYQTDAPVRAERPMDWMDRARRAEDARLEARRHELLLEDRREEARRRRLRDEWSPRALAHEAAEAVRFEVVWSLVSGGVRLVGRAVGSLLP